MISGSIEETIPTLTAHRETRKGLDDRSQFEPTVLGAVAKYRWLVLGVIVAIAAATLAYSTLSPRSYEAVASVVVEDPRAASLFDVGSSQNPQRYVADQAAILESTIVAERAAALDTTTDDPAQVLNGLAVFWENSSNLIQVSVEADGSEQAVSVANSVVEAYRQIRQEEITGQFAAALGQLDESIAEVESRLVELQADIVNAVESDSARETLSVQLNSSLSRLVELQDELPTASAERLPVLRAELDDVFQQIQTLSLIRGLDRQAPELTALLDEQGRTIDRKASLLQRKDELGVELRRASDGIVLTSPAIQATEIGADAVRLGSVGVFLGLFIGAAAAYFLSVRSRTFGSRAQPESILRAPLLAEVPNFTEERIRREVPVRHNPGSVAAEAFRFIAASLDIESEMEVGRSLKATHLANPEDRRIRTFIVVSPGLGDGKSVVAANTALASAREGRTVLAVDADFGYQRLSGLLMGEREATPEGITNVVEGSTPFRYVVQRVSSEDGSRVDLVSRGTVPVAAPDFFRLPGVRGFFETVAEEYDIVIIDSPPMLRVAYSSLLVRYADRAIAVIPHNGLVAQAEELADRLEYLETDLIGYVYNKAPLRSEMTGSYGSLEDVIGNRNT